MKLFAASKDCDKKKRSDEEAEGEDEIGGRISLVPQEDQETNETRRRKHK